MKKGFVSYNIIMYMVAALFVWTACNNTNEVTSPRQVEALPPIYPDYVGVTIPATIAPMNFELVDTLYNRVDVLVEGSGNRELHINDDVVSFPLEEWRELLSESVGDSLRFTVTARVGEEWTAFRPFTMYVSPYAIDYGLTYRKIAPGYELFSKMGIYERDLSTFEERALLENTMVPGMCMNCHTADRTNPDRFSLHVRGQNGGTLMQIDGKWEMLNLQTDSTLSAGVYAYWHPSGEYIAYSTNVTRQSFHVVADERVEVLDLASDVLVYHPETHQLLSSPLLSRSDVYETFPAFSSDGRKLYFCAARAQDIPADYKEIRYDLCSIDFDAATGSFGTKIDTLIHASAEGKSVTFPRPSYNGKHLMYTLADYGNFSIWHKEADLWLLDFSSNECRELVEVNSTDTESFHNWDSQSHWFVFSSRRSDGLYTRLYMACIDDDGNISKPFLLPQERPLSFYDRSVYSYNVPDFTSKPVELNQRKVERGIVSKERVQVDMR